MYKNSFRAISRFRNDAVLYYPVLESKTGKRGHPKWYDGKIDYANPDLTRCTEYEVNKGKNIAYGYKLYQSSMQKTRNTIFRILLQVGHTQCLYARTIYFFAYLGLINLTRKLLTNFSKNSFYLLPKPLRLGLFLTSYCLLGYSIFKS